MNSQTVALTGLEDHEVTTVGYEITVLELCLLLE